MFLEHFDERRADDLAFALGIGDAFQAREKTIRLVRVAHFKLVALAKISHDLIGFAFAQHAVVDEDADELRSQRAVEQDRHHRRVDASGQRADDASVPYRATHVGDGFFDERGDRPVPPAPADVEEEVSQKLAPVHRVGDFRVEADAVKPEFVVLDGRNDPEHIAFDRKFQEFGIYHIFLSIDAPGYAKALTQKTPE